jgi:hypothetical protein
VIVPSCRNLLGTYMWSIQLSFLHLSMYSIGVFGLAYCVCYEKDQDPNAIWTVSTWLALTPPRYSGLYLKTHTMRVIIAHAINPNTHMHGPTCCLECTGGGIMVPAMFFLSGFSQFPVMNYRMIVDHVRRVPLHIAPPR